VLDRRRLHIRRVRTKSIGWHALFVRLLAIVALVATARQSVACPCKDGDLTWSTDDADHCYDEMTSFVYAPMGYPDSAKRKSEAREKFARCIFRYRAEVARESAERAEMERQAIKAKHEREVSELRAQEAARAHGEREEQERQAEAELRQQRLRDPRWMRDVLSGVVCYDTYVRARALDLIRTEQKYARIGGGMVDKGKLYDLQTNMRRADEEKADTISTAKRIGVSLVPCGTAIVRDIVECLKDSDSPSCNGHRVGEMSGFFDVVDLPD